MNEPAFPVPANEPIHSGTTGMQLRDYFAAKAMAIVWDAFDKGYSSLSNDGSDSGAIAKHAYLVADAMMAERSKT